MPSCLSRKTNLCTAIRATQGQGLMPDGTSRFSMSGSGSSLYGHLDVRQLHRAAGNRGGKNPQGRAVRQGLLHRLRRHHGVGAVINTAKVEQGAKAIVFGLGGIGLNVLQGLRSQAPT